MVHDPQELQVLAVEEATRKAVAAVDEHERLRDLDELHALALETQRRGLMKRHHDTVGVLKSSWESAHDAAVAKAESLDKELAEKNAELATQAIAFEESLRLLETPDAAWLQVSARVEAGLVAVGRWLSRRRNRHLDVCFRLWKLNVHEATVASLQAGHAETMRRLRDDHAAALAQHAARHRARLDDEVPELERLKEALDDASKARDFYEAKLARLKHEASAEKERMAAALVMSEVDATRTKRVAALRTVARRARHRSVAAAWKKLFARDGRAALGMVLAKTLRQLAERRVARAWRRWRAAPVEGLVERHAAAVEALDNTVLLLSAAARSRSLARLLAGVRRRQQAYVWARWTDVRLARELRELETKHAAEVSRLAKTKRIDGLGRVVARLRKDVVVKAWTRWLGMRQHQRLADELRRRDQVLRKVGAESLARAFARLFDAAVARAWRHWKVVVVESWFEERLEQEREKSRGDQRDLTSTHDVVVAHLRKRHNELKKALEGTERLWRLSRAVDRLLKSGVTRWWIRWRQVTTQHQTRLLAATKAKLSAVAKASASRRLALVRKRRRLERAWKTWLGVLFEAVFDRHAAERHDWDARRQRLVAEHTALSERLASVEKQRRKAATLALRRLLWRKRDVARAWHRWQWAAAQLAMAEEVLALEASHEHELEDTEKRHNLEVSRTAKASGVRILSHVVARRRLAFLRRAWTTWRRAARESVHAAERQSFVVSHRAAIASLCGRHADDIATLSDMLTAAGKRLDETNVSRLARAVRRFLLGQVARSFRHWVSVCVRRRHADAISAERAQHQQSLLAHEDALAGWSLKLAGAEQARAKAAEATCAALLARAVTRLRKTGLGRCWTRWRLETTRALADLEKQLSEAATELADARRLADDRFRAVGSAALSRSLDRVRKGSLGRTWHRWRWAVAHRGFADAAEAGKRELAAALADAQLRRDALTTELSRATLGSGLASVTRVLGRFKRGGLGRGWNRWRWVTAHLRFAHEMSVQKTELDCAAVARVESTVETLQRNHDARMSQLWDDLTKANNELRAVGSGQLVRAWSRLERRAVVRVWHLWTTEVLSDELDHEQLRSRTAGCGVLARCVLRLRRSALARAWNRWLSIDTSELIAKTLLAAQHDAYETQKVEHERAIDDLRRTGDGAVRRLEGQLEEAEIKHALRVKVVGSKTLSRVVSRLRMGALGRAWTKWRWVLARGVFDEKLRARDEQHQAEARDATAAHECTISHMRKCHDKQVSRLSKGAVVACALARFRSVNLAWNKWRSLDVRSRFADERHRHDVERAELEASCLRSIKMWQKRHADQVSSFADLMEQAGTQLRARAASMLVARATSVIKNGVVRAWTRWRLAFDKFHVAQLRTRAGCMLFLRFAAQNRVARAWTQWRWALTREKLENDFESVYRATQRAWQQVQDEQESSLNARVAQRAALALLARRRQPAVARAWGRWRWKSAHAKLCAQFEAEQTTSFGTRLADVEARLRARVASTLVARAAARVSRPKGGLARAWTQWRWALAYGRLARQCYITEVTAAKARANAAFALARSLRRISTRGVARRFAQWQLEAREGLLRAQYEAALRSHVDERELLLQEQRTSILAGQAAAYSAGHARIAELERDKQALIEKHEATVAECVRTFRRELDIKSDEVASIALALEKEQEATRGLQERYEADLAAQVDESREIALQQATAALQAQVDVLQQNHRREIGLLEAALAREHEERSRALSHALKHYESREDALIRAHNDDLAKTVSIASKEAKSLESAIKLAINALSTARSSPRDDPEDSSPEDEKPVTSLDTVHGVLNALVHELDSLSSRPRSSSSSSSGQRREREPLQNRRFVEARQQLARTPR